jgi:autotransporter-associated beta strand protein
LTNDGHMGVATRFLFSASISLAFVAGCIPANAERAGNKVRFYNEPGSPYSGSVWGANNKGINNNEAYPDPYIDLKVFSNSPDTNWQYDGGYDAQSDGGRYWKVTGPEGSSLPDDQKVDLDKFDNFDKKPTLQFFGDWSEAYKDVLSGDISLGGDIYNSANAFSYTKNSYFYENIAIICADNVDCGEWKSANPNGVKVEIDPAQSGFGTFSIYIANNPNSIGDIDQGPGGSCFEQDGTGVKVPEMKTCSTDDEKFSGEYTSLKVEGQGVLSLGGNLILEEDFIEFEAQNNARVEGLGGLVKTGEQTTILKGYGFDYEGPTVIQEGVLRFEQTNGIPKVSKTTVEKEGSLDLNNHEDVEIDLLTLNGGTLQNSGDGQASLLTGLILKEDSRIDVSQGNASLLVAGVISGDGGFSKVGIGTTTFSGANSYAGASTIEGGVLALSNGSGIPQASSTLVTGSGRLDLASNSIGGSEFKIDQLSITDGGQVFVRADQPLVSEKIVLNANVTGSDNPGGIAVSLKSKNEPPIRVSEKFDYQSGSLVIAAPITQDPEGKWKIIDGKVDNIDDLAINNTFLAVGSADVVHAFEGLGKKFPVLGPAMYKGYLDKGSLDLVIEAKSQKEMECTLHPERPGCLGQKPIVIEPPIALPCVEDDCSLPVEPTPEPEKPCEGDDCLVGNELPDTDGDGIPDEKDPDADGDGELDQLPGCEVGDDLCDIISDIEGDEDEAWEEEEEVAGEIIDALLDGLEDEEIDLAFSFDYGQLARLVGSGLAPRNVDAAGRGLALHNDLLVDAVFERQPLRQFEELLVAEEVVEESVVEDEAVIEEAVPAQPLWLKTEELSDGEAAEYVEGAVADAADAEAAAADVVSLVDQHDDELDLSKRDGVSAWVKGFGGNSRADDSSILYNDYDLNAYGTSFGVDLALSETFQIGAYANYGDLNVNQHSGETGGGSWNPEGWGGGLTAQYSTRHFYVQGLLGASEFSGEQSRNILRINENLGGNTARGDKSVTSYLGALRIGAPFKTGGVVLEPQGQVVWTRNHEQGFSETRGTEKNLRLKYKSRTTNFAETELGMKLSVPIRTGERALLVPSVRAAWLADWNTNNEGQEIGYKFTNKTVNFDSQLGTENGALIEAGLDYTVQNFNGVSVKLYGRGGVELWNSDRGTTWRASGGVTFQF